MKKIILILSVFVFTLLIFIFLLRPPFDISNDVRWGVAFSKPFAVKMGLDWKEAYQAILDDLEPESIRLPVYWPDVEVQIDNYNFSDYDWMVNEAKKRNIQLILVVGRKLPRWPECHEPEWARNQELQIKNQKLLGYVKKTILRYRNFENLYAWQVENEPFLPFGECPEADKEFLDKEIGLVRSLDSEHPIIVTDSGELSVWFRAAKRADIFGTTMYRIVWNKYTGYLKYPLPPKFFWLKINFIRLFYPKKPIIVSELQAEPWGPKMIYETSLEEQAKSMNLKQFYDNIEYARNVGFPKVYLWGAEWWYWLKVKHGQPEIWKAAREVINPELQN
jgi:hypothetical protein